MRTSVFLVLTGLFSSSFTKSNHFLLEMKDENEVQVGRLGGLEMERGMVAGLGGDNKGNDYAICGINGFKQMKNIKNTWKL